MEELDWWMSWMSWIGGLSGWGSKRGGVRVIGFGVEGKGVSNWGVRGSFGL